jgi:hypothetical protein
MLKARVRNILPDLVYAADGHEVRIVLIARVALEAMGAGRL